MAHCKKVSSRFLISMDEQWHLFSRCCMGHGMDTTTTSTTRRREGKRWSRVIPDPVKGVGIKRERLNDGFTGFLLVGWSLWKERNARTFRGESSAAPLLFLKIWDEASLWAASGYRGLGALLAAAG
jgi:hypothetical protein